MVPAQHLKFCLIFLVEDEEVVILLVILNLKFTKAEIVSVSQCVHLIFATRPRGGGGGVMYALTASEVCKESEVIQK